MRKLIKAVLWGAALIVAVLAAVGFMVDPEMVAKRRAEAVAARIDESETGRRTAGEALFQEILAKNRGKDLVLRQLRDPGSAQWGEVLVRRAGAMEAVCGTVNARNAFGGYVGMTRFVALPELGAASLDDGSAAFADGWRKYCG